MRLFRLMYLLAALFGSLLILTACGGGGSSSQVEPPTSGGDPTYTLGVFEDPSLFKNRCESPRNFNDINGQPYPDVQGSTLYENHWLRSWSNDTYLWYNEIPDLNPGNYNDPLEYFDLLKTDAVTPSGTPKDDFHFTYDTTEYEQLTQSGISVSYGISWKLTSATVPRELYVRYVEPNSPATDANVARGAQVLEIDGVSVETGNTQSDIDTLNAGLYPSSVGESHTFTILDIGATQTRDVILAAEEVVSNSVPITNVFNTNSGNVGYILFNDHDFPSEDKLFAAFESLENSNVSDLILDLRYNGGGYLYIASQVGYMIAGSNATSGKTFELLQFNDKYPSTNPVTGETIRPTPFYSTTSQYSDTYGSGVALPQLNLNRVFILTSGGTCSASEAIINSLEGIDVEVILLGDTTCGKPYGFYATDNCGTTYFTIQFAGINDKGASVSTDGLTPVNKPGGIGDYYTGCYVPDELNYTLGTSNEPLVAAALQYRDTGSCPAITKFAPISAAEADTNAGELRHQAHPFENTKLYDDPFKNKDNN